jgi:hypothetical protein
VVFTYLNDDDVWDAFCGTYEGIYDLLGRFDTWYSTYSGNSAALPLLQDEWREYIETVLSSLVSRSRTTFDAQYAIALG